MAEQLKSKRVEFKFGKQKEFIEQSKKELNLTWQDLAEVSKTSTRNLNDWKNEKNSMSLFAVENICKKRRCKMPENIVVKDAYWYVEKAGIAGGKAVYTKYGIIGGNQDIRKEKWSEWWEKEGKFHPNDILKPLSFKKPKFSKELAEFVGIVLGDGGITNYQIKITLHSTDDFEYSCFVEKLIEKLFGIIPSKKKRHDCNVLNIVLSRIELIKFLVKNIGLKTGNKVAQQVDISQWIMKNKNFSVACLRGLIDTDGCVIIHRYKSRGKSYLYKKISFTNRSLALISSARKILNELEIKNRITKNNYEIRIEARRDVEKYFNVVGSHNSKHLLRYSK